MPVKRLIATVALGLALVGAAPAAALEPEDLQLLASRSLSPRLVELTFRTAALSADTQVRVLLPDGYNPEGARRYPVLFLLHGAADDETAWTVKGDAERLTAAFPLIVVMPDSGPGGGYVDWHNGGDGGPPMWETYHVRQLLPWIDAHFRTIGARAGRAVAGLSMGGFGTMSYAARHPDLFVSATTWSGAVDTNSLPMHVVTGSEGLATGRPGAVHGHRATEEVRWRGHNPVDLAPNLDGLDLTLRTGNGMPGGPGGDTGDPVEAEVHQQGVSMHERLAELGLPHIWDDYGAGGHTWFYWQRGLRRLLPDLIRTFADPPPPASPFSFRAIEPRYGVYGWEVEIDRPALEFSELRDADRRGFTLSGSGTAIVTTAPLYTPGERLDVRLTSGSGIERRRLLADEDRRLRIRVPLGPGNPYQQYSPLAAAGGGTVVRTARVTVARPRTRRR